MVTAGGSEVSLARGAVGRLAAETVSKPGYILPPVRCERLTEVVARGGGTWTRRAGARRVEYALPGHATEEVREFLRASATVDLGEEGTALLPGGRVFGAGAVLAADGASVARDVSEDFGKTDTEHWLVGFREMRAPETLEGTTAVVATTLGDGYAHWLLEELPRMIALGAKLTECDAVIAHEAGGLGRAALARLGFAGRVIGPRRRAHYGCERLVVPSLVGRAGWPTAEVVRSVNMFAAESGEVRSPWGERIYVSREKAGRRRVTNEAALAARLAARGFVTVRAEEWSWAEQRAGFRGAKEIVAPHGAGLANLVWCAPGTRVVEVFPRAYVNGCFWRLAAVVGLDYRPVVAVGEGAVRCELAANKEDFAVDADAVERALA